MYYIKKEIKIHLKNVNLGMLLICTINRKIDILPAMGLKIEFWIRAATIL